MAVSITIRNVSDNTRNRLAERAAASGRSLQEFLSSQLERLAAQDDPELMYARIRSAARSYPPVTSDEIVADLEADRR